MTLEGLPGIAHGHGRATAAVRYPPIRSPLALCCLALLCLLAGSALGEDIRIKDVRTQLADGSYLLDANVAYAFSDEALEALNNGVPLTLLVHIQVRRAAAWIWEDSVADIQLRYAIRYKPLSERYEVYRLPGRDGNSFVGREAAIAALGEIRNLHLVDADRLTPGEAYEVQIKIQLDIEELPLPLRPIAYLRPAWKLGSSWTKWPLSP
jgi:hypothetical protein